VRRASRRFRPRLFALTFAVTAAGGACAETTAPLPPPDEILVVVNTGDATLSLVFLGPEAPPPLSVPIGANVPADARPAGGRRFVVAATGGGDSLAVVDLTIRRFSHFIPLEPGSGALGVTLLNDTTAYVALSARDAVLRVNLISGDTLSIPVGRFPKDVTLARGRLFVVNANVDPCPPPDNLCPAGESWLTVVDPVTNQRAAGRDSIPLPGPGNASYATLGADGRLYVMSAGGPEAPQGRLSLVDPLARAEVGSFGGFGERPGPIAADRGERILVSSRTQGLMEFNTRTRSVTRGAGNGIPVAINSGVATDMRNNVYGVESGPCIGNVPGRVRMFRPDLTEIRTFLVGFCAGAAAFALIPPEPLAQIR
jgi:hypothetical protein